MQPVKGMENIKMEENKTSPERKKKGIGAGGIIGISIVYILLGLAMLFFPKFNEIYIIYIVCAVLIVAGILMIVRYFLSGSFKDLQAYGFSFGVLAIVGGFCILIRSQLVADYFGLFLGICIMLTAVIKLQNAVDLSSMSNRSWIIFLVLALLFLAAAVWIILDPIGMIREQMYYIYYVLVADGAVGIFSSVYMIIAIRIYDKWEASGKPERGFEKRKREREEAAAKAAAEAAAARARAEEEAANAPLSIEEKPAGEVKDADASAKEETAKPGEQAAPAGAASESDAAGGAASAEETPQPADESASSGNEAAESAGSDSSSLFDEEEEDDGYTSINAKILRSIFANNNKKDK